MPLNYIDTLTLYTRHRVDLNVGPWVRVAHPTDSAFNRYYIQEETVYLHYYPNLYGQSLLYITVSVPKTIVGNNIFPTDMADMHKTIAVIQDALNRNVPSLGYTSTDIPDMLIARLDLFFMHEVGHAAKQNHLEAYSKLQLGNYSNYRYQNKTTSYLFSGRAYTCVVPGQRKKKAPNIVVRIYDKPKEHIVKKNDIPKEVEDDYDYFLSCDDQPEDFVRFEIQMRWHKLKLLGVSKLSDALDNGFQVDTINSYIKRLKLDRPILSVQNYRQRVSVIFKRKPTLQKAYQLATIVRNGKKPAKPTEYAYISAKLKANNIHIVTSRFGDLPPLPML